MTAQRPDIAQVAPVLKRYGISATLYVTDSLLPLTYLVAKDVDPQLTIEAGANPEPFTVKVKAAPPALAKDGACRIDPHTPLTPAPLCASMCLAKCVTTPKGGG